MQSAVCVHLLWKMYAADAAFCFFSFLAAQVCIQEHDRYVAGIYPNPLISDTHRMRVTDQSLYSRTLPGWHLDHVEVVDDASGTTYYFPCSSWLDKNEGDGATERVLKVSLQFCRTVLLSICLAI
jgi:hypothetical protein